MSPNQLEKTWNQLMRGELLYRTMDKRVLNFRTETETTPVYQKTESELKDNKGKRIEVKYQRECTENKRRSAND